MRAIKKLIFFTNSYPYGFGELWKTNELNVLVKYFEEITVVPFSYAGNRRPEDPIDGIRYYKPLFEDGIPAEKWYRQFLTIVFSRHFFFFLKVFFDDRVFSSLEKSKKWLVSSRKMLFLFNHPLLRDLVMNDENVVLYFFWGRETSEVLPLFKNRVMGKSIVRFHRYDLYKYANDGYIPYQKQQISSLSYALACSEDGKRTLDDYYPTMSDKIIVKRLGTISLGMAEKSKDGIFRIVSCSSVEPVKRVALILKALHHVTNVIEWTHIGGGSLLEELKFLSKGLGKNITVKFLGQLPSKEVMNYYIKHPVDLFINVSSSEGVPVSIMEALASGIPVLATDVGGTSEIVDDSVGRLLPKDITPAEIANTLHYFVSMDSKEIDIVRRASFGRYVDRCDAVKLAHELGRFLNS